MGFHLNHCTSLTIADNGYHYPDIHIREKKHVFKIPHFSLTLPPNPHAPLTAYSTMMVHSKVITKQLQVGFSLRQLLREIELERIMFMLV